MPPKTGKYACGDCKKKCGSSSISCSLCKLWYHSSCQDINADELKVWGKILSYVCASCRTVDGTDFDYLMGLHRLQEAAYNNDLETAVRRETLLKAQFHIGQDSTECKATIDPIAAAIMKKHVDDVIGNPLSTTGDGDCLFNALSLLLFGNEGFSMKLRYHTCLNMITNKEIYKKCPKQRSISSLSPAYDDACIDCAEIGGYSSAWTIMALCDVINMGIRVIYPHFNGISDIAFQTLNCVFSPTVEVCADRELCVLWYRQGEKPVAGTWYGVNHFAAVKDVCTVNRKQRKPRVLDSDDEWQAPKRRRYFPSPIENDFQDDELACGSRYDILRDESCSFIEDVRCDPAIHTTSQPETYTRDTPPRVQHDRNTASNPGPSVGDTPSRVEQDIPPANIVEMKKAPNKNMFLSNEELFRIVSSSNAATDAIPNGPKNDVYVVLKHTRNENGTKANFHDDCGVWDTNKGSTVNQSFVLSEKSKLNGVRAKDGKYCLRKMIQGKITFVPIEPQPTDIVTMHRYYATLKGNNGYRKRVTTFLEVPSVLKTIADLAVVEYSGEKSDEKCIPHGNSKSNEPYIRTNPEILRKAGLLRKSNKASVVYHDLSKDDNCDAPKSTRQIQDKFYRENKRDNPFQSTTKNIADEIMEIISNIHSNPFIQEIIMTKNKQPAVILYRNEQIADLKKNCLCKNGSVLGVDRTFNLGKCYVTSFSYKNRSVTSRKTQEHPVMLGPILLHWDGEQATYNKFFNHIRNSIGQGPLIIGSDEEKAMTNALQENFPNATFLLCTKHLKDNITRFLEKTGTEEKDRKRILKLIFDEECGIVFSTDENSYSSNSDCLEHYFRKNDKFRVYWNRYMNRKLNQFVYNPLKNNKIQRLWTNNNSESINHRIKQIADWKQHKLPELVNRLNLVTNIQLLDLRRALYGTGNYKLERHADKHRLTPREWGNMSVADRENLFWTFLNDPVKAIENCSRFVTASNSNFKCIKSNSTSGRKPGQRRRAKPERTVSAKFP